MKPGSFPLARRITFSPCSPRRSPCCGKRAASYARMLAETTYLQQLRAALRAQSEGLMDDLLRGFDYQGGALAEKRSDLARRIRLGEEDLVTQLDEVKQQQTL